MNVEDEVLKVVLSTTAKLSIEKIVKRLSAKKNVEINRALVQQRLELHARTISSVKTLLSTETFVPISDFYCAPSVRYGSERFVPKSSSDFRSDHVLVEGEAGQGKSTLLRYLCANSIVEQGKICFFYELRRLDHLKPLATILLGSLEELGLPHNSEALKSLSAERDVEVYLDGFDEVSQKDAEKIDRDLAFFAANYPLVKIVLAARSHVGLAQHDTLETYHIEPLDQADAFRLIDKICREDGLADSLKEKLRAHKGDASRLLETPLLVTLLVAKYAQTRQIPEQLSEFYASIFLTLFEKHDSFKLPFRRQKRLGLSTHSYQALFEQFCFGSLFIDALSTKNARELAKWAMDSQRSVGDPADLLRDISDVSSLIHEQAGAWSYIHKSLQEFYAASYLLSGTDEELGNRGAMLVDVQNAATRDQVFRFSAELDDFRYLKFVELPFHQKLTAPLSLNSPVISDQDCLSWLESHGREFLEDKNIVSGGNFFSLYTDCLNDTPIRLFASDEQWPLISGVITSVACVDAIRAICKVSAIRSRMINEARRRIEPLMARHIEARDAVEKMTKSRASSSTALAAILASAK